jgi:hypothetical protein
LVVLERHFGCVDPLNVSVLKSASSAESVGV